MVSVIAQAGDPDRAETLARTIPDPYGQAEALTKASGHRDRAGRRPGPRAETLARTIPEPDRQAGALAGLVTVASPQAGDLDRAETLARAITSPDRQARRSTGLVHRGRAGRRPEPRPPAGPAAAQTLARAITIPSPSGRGR